MFPLIYNCRDNDIIIVEINPIVVTRCLDQARAIPSDRMIRAASNAQT